MKNTRLNTYGAKKTVTARKNTCIVCLDFGHLLLWVTCHTVLLIGPKVFALGLRKPNVPRESYSSLIIRADMFD